MGESANCGADVHEESYLIPSAARDLGCMCREPVRFIYILASQSRVLYTGITSDLSRRVYQHKHGLIPGFTRQYAVNRLMYFESTSHIRAAIERERQVKSWRREKKVTAQVPHHRLRYAKASVRDEAVRPRQTSTLPPDRLLSPP